MDRSDVSLTSPSPPDPAGAAEGGEGIDDAGVCSPRGFRAGAAHCGLKRRHPDIALLVSDRPAAAAGMFTTNQVQAAPVHQARRVARGGTARAVVVAAGNANACTGEQGERDAVEMAAVTAGALGCGADRVLVASTGLIGVPLPMDRVRRGIRDAASSLSADGRAAARAILTTDRATKTAAARVRLGSRTVTIGGTAKGAGMVHPDMATTLGFVTTDAPVEAPVLQACLREAVDASFNRISVDGETSTNDAVLALANGAAGGPTIDGGSALDRFRAALSDVTRSLALQVVRDGEGATKLVELAVEGAADDEDARRVASRLCRSPLVKTALGGEDPNWGRVLAAAGSAGAELDPARVGVHLGDVPVVRDGAGVADTRAAAARALADDEVRIRVDLGLGSGRAVMWTCDLTEKYVRINRGYAS